MHSGRGTLLLCSDAIVLQFLTQTDKYVARRLGDGGEHIIFFSAWQSSDFARLSNTGFSRAGGALGRRKTPSAWLCLYPRQLCGSHGLGPLENPRALHSLGGAIIGNFRVASWQPLMVLQVFRIVLHLVGVVCNISWVPYVLRIFF